MTPEKSTTDVHDTAAAWVARTDRGPLSPEEQLRLDTWLAEHPRHMGAYVRAQAAWQLTAHSEIAGAAIAIKKPLATNRRRFLVWGAGPIAASLVAIVLGTKRLVPRRFATEVGEVAQKSLSDGSVVALDTASIMTEHFEPSQRNVKLDQGQAFFDVAKDATRPFVVSAGPIRIRAVGTAFIVNRVINSAHVVVTEGTVSVWNIAAPGQAIRLTAGQSAVLDDDAQSPATIQMMTAAQINQKAAWRTGQIILSGETLAHAVDEFNRYNTDKIEIADPALAQKTLVGGFRASDPRGFAAIVASVLHAKVQTSDRTIILTR